MSAFFTHVLMEWGPFCSPLVSFDAIQRKRTREGTFSFSGSEAQWLVNFVPLNFLSCWYDADHYAVCVRNRVRSVTKMTTLSHVNLFSPSNSIHQLQGSYYRASSSRKQSLFSRKDTVFALKERFVFFVFSLS